MPGPAYKPIVRRMQADPMSWRAPYCQSRDWARPCEGVPPIQCQVLQVDATHPEQIGQCGRYCADKFIFLRCKELTERAGTCASVTSKDTKNYRRHHAEQGSSRFFANAAKSTERAGQRVQRGTAKQFRQSGV